MDSTFKYLPTRFTRLNSLLGESEQNKVHSPFTKRQILVRLLFINESEWSGTTPFR